VKDEIHLDIKLKKEASIQNCEFLLLNDDCILDSMVGSAFHVTYEVNNDQ
jgi:hypothetical protein